jgi:hypothetical protein
MMTHDADEPVNLSKTEARGGVTGHNVRYVLGFGLAGIVLAFLALGLYFGLGEQPNPPPETPTSAGDSDQVRP